MDKQKIPFIRDENAFETVKYGNFDILINPFLTYSQRITLVEKYLETYFNPDENFHYIQDLKFDRFNAEMELILRTLDMKTNIELEDFDFDAFMASGMWSEIKARIINFNTLLDDIEIAVEEVKEQKRLDKALGSVLEQIFLDVSMFVSELREGVENLDADKLEKVSKDILKEIEKSPISQIFKESAQSTKSNKKTRVM